MALKAFAVALVCMGALGILFLGAQTPSTPISRARLLQQVGPPSTPIPEVPAQAVGPPPAPPAATAPVAENVSTVAPAAEISVAAAPAPEIGLLVPGPEGELESASAALFAAVQSGNVPEMQRLFALGASTDVYSPDGTTPLLDAIRLQEPAVISALLAKGVDTNLASKPGGVTPLALALSEGNVPLSEQLLNAGADINLRNAAGDTALLQVVKQRPVNYQEVQLLLSRKPSPTTSAADLTARDAQGRTAQDIATASGDPQLIGLFAAALAPAGEVPPPVPEGMAAAPLVASTPPRR